MSLKIALVLGSVWAMITLCPPAVGRVQKAPIGTMFDNASIGLDSAFRHKIEQLNRRSDTLSIYRISNATNGSDSFIVSNAICSLRNRGVFAIIGLTNSSSAATIQSYADASQIPFITTSMARNYNDESTFLVQMRPDYTRGILDLIKHYTWKHVYYIYMSDEGMLRLQELFRIFNQDISYQLDLDPRRVPSAEDGYRILKRIYENRDGDSMHVVLDMDTSQAQSILLKTVNDRNVSRGYFHYLLTDLGIMDLDLSHFQFGGINLTGFQLVNINNASAKLFLDEWSNLNPSTWNGAGRRAIQYEAALVVDAVDLFSRAVTLYLRENQYPWEEIKKTDDYDLISGTSKKCTGSNMNKPYYGRSILDNIRNIRFEGITGPVDIDERGFRTGYTLQIMEINVNRGPAKSDPYVMPRTKPLDGHPLTSNKKYMGYCIDLAELVAEKVNFEYVIHVVNDGLYGAKDNETWNGMIGELVNNEADIAIADLTITAIRERAVDFTKPFMSLGITIMIKRPVDNPPGVFSFMDPLSYEIWMCILFAYTGVSVVLFLVSRFSPSEWYVEDDSNVSNDFSISNSFWFALGAFMQQGCEISPRSVSGRIAGCVWWFFTLIIISSYTANLAAFLTVERMSTPIESAEDLVKQTAIKYGTLQSGATTEFFKTSEVALYQRMYAYMSAQPNVFAKTIKEGIARVRNSDSKYAILLESTTIDYFNHKEPCDTIKVGSNLDSKGFGIATPVGSDLRDMLTLAVLSLRESGKLTQMFNEWWNKSRGCGNIDDKLDGGTQSSLNLRNVAGIFFILIGGLILAVVTAFSEFIYKSRVDSRRTKTTFGSALRSKARLSFRGHNEDGPTTYRYSAPTQMIGMDGYNETNTHTQV